MALSGIAAISLFGREGRERLSKQDAALRWEASIRSIQRKNGNLIARGSAFISLPSPSRWQRPYKL
jgi:hypothetical protein